MEHNIKLMDGRLLACYPKEDGPSEAIDNELKLDTSGRYLIVGRRQAVPSEQVKDERKELDRKLFLDHAFLFIENRERILSDSRMFLCPIPIQSGLAYTGTSGFQHPTLGVYVEWWLNCPQANICAEEDDERWIVYHLAGSPLSGGNHCGLVNQKGKTKTQSLSEFRSLWTSFQKVNRTYDQAKALYQAYTISEVLDIFQEEGRTEVHDQDINLYFLEQANQWLKQRVQTLKDYGDRLYRRLHETLMRTKKEELKAFLTESYAIQAKADRRLAEIQEIRISLRRQLKSGELSSKEYQKAWGPFRKERESVKYGVYEFSHENLHRLFPEDCVSLSEIEKFLKNDESKE